MRELTLGSLFDGLGGWLLAAKENGIRPIWSSEIDDFPMAVSKYHFPEVQQLGDITKLDGAELPPVDIICAGSPCQDLSIAGKREGLAGERSGLFRKAIDIVRGMRKATNGEYPKWFVWENVPGAFSSNKGHDFRAVLEEITETDIPMPDSGRWSKGGLVRSPKCNVAWRTLDAQYWGVPQRRARIFLIAGFGADSRPEVLFEPESLFRNTEESQDKRKSATRDTAQSADTTSWAFEPGITSRVGRKLTENKSTTLRADMGDNQTAVLTPWDVQSNSIVSENGKAATLYGGAGQGTHNGAVMQSIGLDLYNGNTTGDIAATITASSGNSAAHSGPSVMQKCYGISSYESNSMKSQNPSSGIYEADKARTLDTSGGNTACNQGGIAIAEAKTIGIATQSYYDMQISDKGATLRAAGGAYGGAVRIMPCKSASGKSGKEDNKKCNIL